MTTELGKIDQFCPSCNVHVEATVLAQHSYETAVLHEDLFDPSERAYTEDLFTFAACIRCNRPLLVKQALSVVEGMGIPASDSSRVYPREVTMPEAVPNAVAKPYHEAHRAYRVKIYNACAAMCRRTLEAVCGHYGESKGVLSRRLDRLRQHGIIDKAMFDWTQELRLSGNKGAHADPEDVTETEAKDLLEFAQALLLYAFELPKRLQRARERRVGSP